jgi:hypothetical protein
LRCVGCGCYCQFPWSNEINCQINECGANNKCLVATKSTTGPNQANQITSTSKDQLFQCRSKSNLPGLLAFYIFVIIYTTYINFLILLIKSEFTTSTNPNLHFGNSTYEIDIAYAEMWKCKANGAISSPTDCPSNTAELLPNVFSLTRYW